MPAARTAAIKSAGLGVRASAMTWRISSAVRFAVSNDPSTLRRRRLVTKSSKSSAVFVLSPLESAIAAA